MSQKIRGGCAPAFQCMANFFDILANKIMSATHRLKLAKYRFDLCSTARPVVAWGRFVRAEIVEQVFVDHSGRLIQLSGQHVQAGARFGVEQTDIRVESEWMADTAFK